MLAGQSGGHRVPLAQKRMALTTRREIMSGISRWPKLKPRPGIELRRRITTSMPNIISDRCPRAEKRNRKVAAMWKAIGVFVSHHSHRLLHRKRPHQHSQRHLCRLAPVENRFDDFGREQRQPQNPADIGRVDLLGRAISSKVANSAVSNSLRQGRRRSSS